MIPGLAKEKPDAAIVKGQVGSVLWQFEVKDLNRLQHLAVEKSRLHIPLLIGFDVIHGYRTIFPVPLAMASSWDPAVEEAAQHQAAQDARAAGIQWTFTPMVDIARDARWGRIVEGAGEDPYLGAAMAAAQVRGFQGESIGPKVFWPASSILPGTARPKEAATTTPRTFPKFCFATSTWFPFMRQKRPAQPPS